MNILVFRWNLASKVFQAEPVFHVSSPMIVECHPLALVDSFFFVNGKSSVDSCS